MNSDARIPGKTGTVRVSRRGDVVLHTYISPEDGLCCNTQIVEGPSKLIIFDGQFFLSYAAEAAAYAGTLDKPAERIILSHIHLDHWSGLEAFTARFPEAGVWAPRGVADFLREHGQRILGRRRPVMGGEIPACPTVPTQILSESVEVIDGIPFEFRRYLDAESAIQLVAVLPAQRVLMAFDLAFAPDEHVFTVTAHFDRWIAVLQELHALPSYERVLSGHGEPTDRRAILATIDYLRIAKMVHAGSATAPEYAERMKQVFADRNHPNWIELSASLLYNVDDAYVTDR